MKILIVSDFLNSICHYTWRRNCILAVYCHAELLLQKESFDLVLLGRWNKVMDLYPVLEELRKHPCSIFLLIDNSFQNNSQAMIIGQLCPLSGLIFETLTDNYIFRQLLDERDQMQRKIGNLLSQLTLSPSTKGCRYLKQAIFLSYVSDRPLKLKDYCTEIMSHSFDLSYDQIERCMRHGIEKIFRDAEIDLLQLIFGSMISAESGKVTVTDFVYLCEEYLRYE